MIRRLLVADRGEIARRVFATCRSLGIETVAVYSDPDAGAPYVAEADYAVHLPGSVPSATYLRGDLLIAAARKTLVDAIHPGSGLLAENPDFAQAVADADLLWIGPPAKVMEVLGDTAGAGELVAEAAVPALQSWTGPKRVGEFPGARHLEVQILADQSGTVVILGERECSIRRRHQKVIEEAPSPVVSPDLRDRLCRAAIAAAQAVGYAGVGTVKFLLSPSGEFSFLGMSTRLQAEHAVTECVTGVDLVRMQIVIAEGGALPVLTPPPQRGHAIEARLCAEDPSTAFRPATGVVHRLDIPGVTGGFGILTGSGIRFDSGVEPGSVIGVHNDSLLAKVVAWAPTRLEAARLLASALARARIHGVLTNRDLLVRTLRHPSFLAGQTDTSLLDRHPELFAPLLCSVDGVRLSCLAAALGGAAARRASAASQSGIPSGWRNVPTLPQSVVYAGPAGPVEVCYRLGRRGDLVQWSVRAIDPEELDLAGLGSAEPLEEQATVAVVSATPALVVLDVAGVRLTVHLERVGDVTYVDSVEGSLALTELPRFPLPGPDVATAL
jgi:propionyl-CoA carboxylase alpha chain